MKYSDWSEPEADFIHDYTPETVSENWEQLHQGNQEPLPDDNLLDAWCAFHNGHYASAAEQGEALGTPGTVVAVTAIVAYTDYLCEDEEECEQWLQHAMQLASDAIEADPDHYNHHFSYALAAGRYSQLISITKALRKGLAGKVKAALETTLKMQPNHAEAHTAMGLYHAEIIDKIGSTIGGLTYGAKASKAHKHFDQSLKLTPNTAITLIEKGNGLLLLEGDDATDDATALYEQAAECEALNCLQAMDIEFASSQLEEE
ncbi:hypothetical protein [Marinicella sp. W31]|uniref:hypothetical protein n=1 Tax=Marinicella sp. W31 TaxID=3023713 RepID=UPI003756F56D